MSFHRFDEDILGPMILGSNPECFFCSGKIGKDDVGCVQWRGYPGMIHLHAECALKLGAHLIMDARDSEHTGERSNTQVLSRVFQGRGV